MNGSQRYTFLLFFIFTFDNKTNKGTILHLITFCFSWTLSVLLTETNSEIILQWNLCLVPLWSAFKFCKLGSPSTEIACHAEKLDLKISFYFKFFLKLALSVLLISSFSLPCPRSSFVFWYSVKSVLKHEVLDIIIFYTISGYSSPFVQTDLWRNPLTEGNFDLLLFKSRHLKRHNWVQIKLDHHKNQWFRHGGYLTREKASNWSEEFIQKYVYTFQNLSSHTGMSYWPIRTEISVIVWRCCSSTDISNYLHISLTWMLSRNVLVRTWKVWI